MKKVLYSVLVLAIFFINCSSEKNKWLETKKKDTLQSYEAFSSLYPNSIYSDSVKYLIEKLNFEKSISKNSLTDFEEFNRKFPNSIFNDSVNFMIEKLYFEGAKIKNSLIDLEEFNKKFPLSNFTDSIKILINNILPKKSKVIKCEIKSAKKQNCKIQFDIIVQHRINSVDLSFKPMVCITSNSGYFMSFASIEKITPINLYTKTISCCFSNTAVSSCSGSVVMDVTLYANDYKTQIAKFTQHVDFK